MDSKYMCYCGLYCANCIIKVKVEPSAKLLRAEMEKAGFQYFIQAIPNGEAFWAFLNNMTDNGACTSCQEGGGDPDCPIRQCAKEKNLAACANCDEYPCKHFDDAYTVQPALKGDNELLRDQGLEAWGKMQDERRKQNFCYAIENPPPSK